MTSGFIPPPFGANNLRGADTDSSSLPSIDCGNEIIYQSVFSNHSSKNPIRIKLITDHDEKVKDIRLVHLYPNSECLYIVSGDGKLYSYDISKESKLRRIIIDNNEDLEILQISSYTEAVLFIVRNKVSYENFIYGNGNNGYFRMTHNRTNDYVCSKPELMFEPGREMPNIGEPYVINHIGCCYSFSCCVINDTLVHFTGQNWLSAGQTHVDGYLTWPILIQDVKKPVTKIECGDFHVVILHKDGTVVVAGNNSSNQLTMFTPTYATYGIPFVTIFSEISNIYSGSNSVLYQSKMSKMEKLRYHFHGARSFNFISTKDKKKKKGLNSHQSQTILEQQFTRDFLMHRYEDCPDTVYLDGSSYYGSNPFDNTDFSIRTLVPFDEFNKGFYPKHRENDFYKEIVKVILQTKGMIFICDYGRGLSSKIFTQLIKSTDFSCENNRLLLDTVIHAQH